MLAPRLAPRTTTVTEAPADAMCTAAWPAELPAPMMNTAAPSTAAAKPAGPGADDREVAASRLRLGREAERRRDSLVGRVDEDAAASERDDGKPKRCRASHGRRARPTPSAQTRGDQPRVAAARASRAEARSAVSCPSSNAA
jgi:hypothetical protein